MKNNEKKILSLLGGIILGVVLIGLMGCVSKHPKCEAYDKCQNPQECVK